MNDNQNTATKAIAPIIHFPADAPLMTFPKKENRVLAKINAARKLHRKTSHPATSDDAVDRATDRIDAAYVLPISRIDESEAMLRLVLESEGEHLDESILAALHSVARVLTASVEASKAH